MKKAGLYILLVCVIAASSCSVTRQINKQAVNILLNDSVISTGHTGISIYEPATNKYWYNYDAAKYFVPASNTKLFSLYAGMKYLGDSLVGIRYKISSYADEDSPSIIRTYMNIEPTGDPTLLHPRFIKQPIYDFFKKFKGSIKFEQGVELPEYYGKGWAWDDYSEEYMPARSAFPIYGNVATFKGDIRAITINPPYLLKADKVFINSDAEENKLYRAEKENKFYFFYKYLIQFSKSIPIIPDTYTITSMLGDTLGKSIGSSRLWSQYYKKSGHINEIIHSQPSDSLFTPMMHNSDNFFAEQTLLMASNERLGYMNDEAIIDTLLSTDLKDIPQKPKWVDGSGLSRYNLFTPQDFIYILTKMKNEFGLERLKTILPTGNTGTLKNYYITDSSFIFAKTGSLSNHIAFSGFLITKKNKLLIFSVLNNHFIGKASTVRRAVEKFLKGIREAY